MRRVLLLAALAMVACEDHNPTRRGVTDGGADAAPDGGGLFDGSVGGDDGSIPRTDRGVEPGEDAAVGPDQGAPGEDAGLDPDQGIPDDDAGPDQGVPDDDGGLPPDGGEPDPDAGPDVDGGADPDAGEPDPDAGDECRRDCDDDGFEEDEGDCDDANPDIFPGAEEQCDGVDNDCDGEIDGLVVQCYDGADDTLGVGLCRPGARTCVDGEFGACAEQRLPGEETCGDGTDEDCDGDADEGCDQDMDGFDVVDDCDDGDPEVNPDADEVCDDVDNDCDGVTDGLREDCYEGPPGTAGVGPCAAGASTCVAGEFGNCEGQVLPGDEACGNEIDDDCDGDVDEGCQVGACPEVSLDTPVELTVDCLAAGAAGASIIVVGEADGRALEDVQISAAPAVPLGNPRQLPDGRWYRVVRPTQQPVEARFTVTVGCDDGSRVALRQQPVLRVEPTPPVGTELVTGGCALDGNLQVTVVDAATGVGIDGAWVLAGEAPARDLQPDAGAALQGRAGRSANFGQAAGGVLRLRGLGGTLAGPTPLTVGAEGYENVTLVGFDAGAVVVPLRSVDAAPAPSAELNGRFSEFDDLSNDGESDAGLIVGSFDLPFLATLALPRLLSRNECWDPVTEGFAGRLVSEVPVPGNLYVPRQAEAVFGLPVVVEEHRFNLDRTPLGVDQFVALSGKVPTDVVVDILTNGGADLASILEVLDLQEIGVLRDLDVQADRDDLVVPLATGLRANARCEASNLPADADLFCVTAGDWSGGDGTGRLFPMGLANADATSVDEARPGATELEITTVADGGVFRDIGYLGVAVALYLGDDDPPGLDDAVSAVLQREGLDAGGGVIAVDDFFDATALRRDGRSVLWDPVANDASPEADACRVDVVRTLIESYDPGPCSNNLLDTREVPLWTVYAAGDPGAVTLPELPEGWPRQAQGGLIDPDATQERDRVDVRVSCLGLGQAPDFEFNAGNFRALIDGLTHISSNIRPF